MLNWWLPENVSTYGADIDWLFHLIYWITGITAILVFVTMAIFLVQYRDRPGRRARYTHGSTPLEIAWTVVPALILVVLTFLSVPAWSRIKMSTPESDFVVRVSAKQFNWEVTYPGPDGKFDTADDKTFDNELHAPVNKPVLVKLRSKDVIHSFFVPSFRIKQDAVPGREITAWFEAVKPGKYENPCAELCGFGHSGMKGWVFVHTAEDYQKWATANLTAAAPAPATTVALSGRGRDPGAMGGPAAGQNDAPKTEETSQQ
jgi:cytochrome c oxidase subunit 2